MMRAVRATPRFVRTAFHLVPLVLADGHPLRSSPSHRHHVHPGAIGFHVVPPIVTHERTQLSLVHIGLAVLESELGRHP